MRAAGSHFHSPGCSSAPVTIVQFHKEPASGKRLREKTVKTLEALK
ncbi:MAG TPA: hypothetical protein VNM14_25315 [Planctomycetota bacterium]|nr:hypothetical protein [Planctomycetota bacterium]